MSLGHWLALSDYSTKYRVSVSTLRRRIKAEDINFQLRDGKYFLVDEPMSAHQKHRPSQESDVEMMGAHLDSSKFESSKLGASKLDAARSDKLLLSKIAKDEPILTAANKLLTELKKAYTQILFEKEEQILRLKEEVSDLKTLVKVLESENNKKNSLKNN